ncbi:hypothetical protein GLOIN_2v1785889 [Rhizophagus irregularis DAOM 181602=DAOM 197198]|nr:hypothetical protein GLOIN_2v1785889 [Rhizophagus irregularis DAOM 181602=DAOM 197198]
MVYTAEKLATIFGCTVSDLMAINREILKSQQNPHAVSVIPELRHKKAEEAYDRAVEKKEKANDALGQSLEEEGILRELEWEAYQKACKERTNAAVEHIMVKEAIRRCSLQL